ncbi:hypothetical protein [Ammoniphilus sp. CFH 90114]|uniref:hypothetical protein n=1 Tax=Ammoniphilus sp. CFH 90114 TaxID=2493665 RepID=UPI00100E4D45|nr:hypothetical protein [Ammoniphilus sp. CFH 90114]RXT08133.1 hypothetical protein EIZ39_12075 [Ammoniphilus sp. CFH 90114]
MIQRKPVSFVLILLSLCMIPLGFLYSYYLFIAAVLFILFRLKVPINSSKCPRCKEENTMEPWVTRYRCTRCKTALYKEKNGWSRIK